MCRTNILSTGVDILAMMSTTDRSSGTVVIGSLVEYLHGSHKPHLRVVTNFMAMTSCATPTILHHIGKLIGLLMIRDRIVK